MPLNVRVTLYKGERLKNLILCYAGPWAFIPYLKCHEDEEILWHAKQGLLLALVEIFITIAILIAGLFPIIGLIAIHLILPIWLMWCLFMSAMSIVQATNGKRHRIPIIGYLLEYL